MNNIQTENRYSIMANKLDDVLSTIVSPKLLELLSDKQMGMLDYQYQLIKGLRKFPMDEDDEKDVERYIATIKNILDFAKSKIKPREYHGTAQYNRLTN